MMAKGPFPLVMVAFPIAVWWYMERSLRMIARGGVVALRPAGVRFVRGLWPRTVRAFRELWLVPGVIVFALCFVPWMVAVGMRHPHAWDLWNWQYLQRVQGKYEDTRPRAVYYYIPVVAGLILPWLFLIFEAMVSPWIAKYARQRRGLLYAGLWGLFGVLIMSLEAFKKPYYVLPAIPALILLMGPVADWFYSTPIRWPKVARAMFVGIVLGGVGLVIGGYFWMRHEMPRSEAGLTMAIGVAVAGFILADLLYLRGRRWAALGLTAVVFILTFHGVWYGYASRLDNVSKVTDLAQVLDDNRIPRDTRIYWVERRPDARLSFYYDRMSEQMIQPEEIVAKFVDRTSKKETLAEMVMDRAEELLSSEEPVYLVMDEDSYHTARNFGMVGDAVTVGKAMDPDQAKNNWVVVANAAADKLAQRHRGTEAQSGER